MARPGERDTDERVGSPPTDRVIAIVELLAGQRQPSSVASVASRLDLNRATATSILLALERAGWAARQADRGYLLGPGLIGVAEAVRLLSPVSAKRAQAIERLADRVGCGAALALVGSTELSFLTVVRGRGQIPPGIGAGVRLPLVPPVAAAVIANREAVTRQSWLASAQPEDRVLLDRVLAEARQNGVVVFGLGAHPETLTVLTEVVELLAEHPRRDTLRQRVFELLTGLRGQPYAAEQLRTSEPLPVSYLTAPVFDEGQATYELQLGPLRAAVSPAERDHYVREIRATAEGLSS